MIQVIITCMCLGVILGTYFFARKTLVRLREELKQESIEFQKHVQNFNKDVDVKSQQLTQWEHELTQFDVSNRSQIERNKQTFKQHTELLIDQHKQIISFIDQVSLMVNEDVLEIDKAIEVTFKHLKKSTQLQINVLEHAYLRSFGTFYQHEMKYLPSNKIERNFN